MVECDMSELVTSFYETMSIPHPWREFAKWSNARIFFRDLGIGIHGLTDGRDVWIHNELLQVERRCAAAHEAEHLRRGHTLCVSGSEEDRVRFAAAKWLCPDPRKVAEAIVEYEHDLPQVADSLWLDVPTLRARLDRRFMHPAERVLIDRIVSEHDTP
jgi:hypothetical protein